MPGQARKDIVQEGEVGIYHTWSRCVQRAWLCGYDPLTQINFDYRREWVSSLLKYLAGVFAVDVGNYSVLSNHQHLIARTRPDISAQWSDEEVAWRWKLAWPCWRDGEWVRTPSDEEINKVLEDPEKVVKVRANLASLSWFMARWKEPIAKMANAELDRRGHFYEQRFGSREVLDDAANLCTNIYVDLNQIKAGMANSLEDCHDSAIQDRLKAWRQEQARESVEAFHANGVEGFSLEVGDVEQLLADCFLAPIGDQAPTMLQPAPVRLILPTTLSTMAEIESPPRTTSAESGDTPPIPGSAFVQVAEYSQEVAEHVIDNDVAFTTNSEPTTGGPTSTAPVENTNSAPAASTAIANAAPVEPVAATSDLIGSTPHVASTVSKPAAGTGRRGRPASTRPPPTFKMHRWLQGGRRHRASDSAYLGIPRKQYLELLGWTAAQILEKRAADAPSHPPPLPPDPVADFLRQRGIVPDHWLPLIEKFERWFRHAIGHSEQMAEPIRRNKRRWIQGIRASKLVFTLPQAPT